MSFFLIIKKKTNNKCKDTRDCWTCLKCARNNQTVEVGQLFALLVCEIRTSSLFLEVFELREHVVVVIYGRDCQARVANVRQSEHTYGIRAIPRISIANDDHWKGHQDRLNRGAVVGSDAVFEVNVNRVEHKQEADDCKRNEYERPEGPASLLTKAIGA